MSINGMIDRAKLAKKYITDEYVKPYNIYDVSMKSYYIDRAELAGELRNGLAQEQFKVYYQPVVDAKTGEIRSAEALIRWVHPKRGFVSPAIFIPALEESGHISELDFYVTKKYLNSCGSDAKTVRKISRYQSICHGWIFMMKR